ncbi:MAG: FeoA family protein [Lachnospiraceae bacterium]|nr:FeoA family protein [Lachnospiraceae bacterium]MDO5550408.1 FeoA family protein [Lachnospiraceae bacterium]
MVIPLNYIKRNQTAQIVWMALPSETERRLAALGFVPGETLSCILRGPGSSMSAYRVQGRIIALRGADANQILVKILDNIREN